MYKIDHYIGGQTVAATSGRTAPIYDPSNGTVQGEVGLACKIDINLAVTVASEAFETWSDVGLMKRVSIMFKFRELLEKNRDELCRHVVKEHGKVWDDAMGEITRGIEIVENACGIPEMLKGDYSQQVGDGIDVYSTRQALGVVCSITPFNFPAMVPLWTIPLAIACGNTFILKPSSSIFAFHPIGGNKLFSKIISPSLLLIKTKQSLAEPAPYKPKSQRSSISLSPMLY